MTGADKGEVSGDLNGRPTKHIKSNCKLLPPSKSAPHHPGGVEQETAAGGIYFLVKGGAIW